MAYTALHCIEEDLTDAQIRDELQVIGIVFYLIDPELSPDQIRTRHFLKVGQSALGRLTEILDGYTSTATANNPADNNVVAEERKNCEMRVPLH